MRAAGRGVARAASTAAAAAAPEAGAEAAAVASSSVIRTAAAGRVKLSERYALGRHKDIHISPQKLNDMCRLVRGLSVEEAMIQMRMSRKGNAYIVANCIRGAKNAALHNMHMDESRLVVAEAWVGHGTHQKRRSFRAKGKMDIIKRYRANLTVVVREMPVLPNEKRLGLVGPRHSTLERVRERLMARQRSEEEAAAQTAAQ